MELPGVGLSIPKFIAILKKETTKYEDIRIKADHLNQAITHLDNLLTVRKAAIEIIDLAMAVLEAKSGDTSLVEYDESQDKYEKTKLKMQSAQKMIEYYKAECAKLEIKESEIQLYCESVSTSKDFKKFSQYTSNDLKEKIASLQEEIYNKCNELDRHRQYIEHILKPEIDTLEHKKPHPFTNYLDELKQISGMVIKMEQKLTLEFDEYIRELKQRNVNKKNITGEKQDYYDLVFEFLAKKIGYILHINEMHELKKIDLIDGIIITTKGTEIRIKDMGTGQSQSAYLTALLSSTDNRKIIALFDEVAMMDSKSLQQVYTKLKELYAQGKLLIAVIVQKGEKLQISRIA